MSCSTASIVPTRLISTATQPPSASRHIRSTGPTSVGHSRRSRRRPSLERLGLRGERLLEVALDAVLLERGRLAHLVLDVGEHLVQADLEPVLAAAGALADDEHVAAVLEARSAASSSSAACSRRRRRGRAPSRRP